MRYTLIKTLVLGGGVESSSVQPNAPGGVRKRHVFAFLHYKWTSILYETCRKIQPQIKHSILLVFSGSLWASGFIHKEET